MKPVFLLLPLICCLLTTGCSIYNAKEFTQYDTGAQQAARHIAKGKITQLDNLGILRYGTQETRDALLKKYGITYKYDPWVSSDYLRGYNSMMTSAAEERYGKDYYKKTFESVTGSEGSGALSILDGD